MQDKLKQIIIHELGHYVARELNFNLFDVGEGVEKVRILTKSKIPYQGQTIAIKPKDYNPKEVNNKAEYIAVLVYGCIFEAVFTDKHFIHFFNEVDSGKHDYSEYNYLLIKYFDEETRIDLICYLRDEYFKLLTDNRNHFDHLFNMNFDNLLITLNDENYEINLEVLKEEIAVFLECHKIFYKGCVSEISRILSLKEVES